MKHIKRFSAGILVILFFTAITACFSMDTLSFLALAVFCSIVITGGLALIVIVPLVYFFGWAAMGILGLFSKTTENSFQKKGDREIMAICDYVDKLDPTLSRDAVIEDLGRAGWDKDKIETALACSERK